MGDEAARRAEYALRNLIGDVASRLVAEHEIKSDVVAPGLTAPEDVVRVFRPGDAVLQDRPWLEVQLRVASGEPDVEARALWRRNATSAGHVVREWRRLGLQASIQDARSAEQGLVETVEAGLHEAEAAARSAFRKGTQAE